MRNKIFLTFLLMFTLAFAEAKIELGLESRDIQAGEPFVFSIVISDANEIKQPAFPDSDAFKCIGMTPHRQNSTQITMVNGKFNRTVINNTTYQITLLASKTGIQEIPSMQLEIDGKKYATQPVRVNVSQAEVITDIALQQPGNGGFDISSGAFFPLRRKRLELAAVFMGPQEQSQIRLLKIA